MAGLFGFQMPQEQGAALWVPRSPTPKPVGHRHQRASPGGVGVDHALEPGVPHGHCLRVPPAAAPDAPAVHLEMSLWGPREVGQAPKPETVRTEGRTGHRPGRHRHNSARTIWTSVAWKAAGSSASGFFSASATQPCMYVTYFSVQGNQGPTSRRDNSPKTFLKRFLFSPYTPPVTPANWGAVPKCGIRA